MSGRIEFASVAEIPAGLWRWPHFDAKTEWACKGTGQIVIVPVFMDLLEELRRRCRFPLPVNSGYRSPEYNAAKFDTGLDGPHTTAMAADIGVSGQQALTLITVAVQLGFNGIGIAQKGPPRSRFIHIDIRDTPGIWSY